MQNQMGKQMEHELETGGQIGIVSCFIGFLSEAAAFIATKNVGLGFSA